jgi:transitional endoplasmic reticulum ATPase
VKPPDYESREKILKIHTSGMKLGTDIDLSQLASDLEGYVGADIAAICREAVMIALREDLNTDFIELRHFREAKKAVHPSINDRIIKEFIELERKLLGKSEIGRKDILGLKDYL